MDDLTTKARYEAAVILIRPQSASLLSVLTALSFVAACDQSGGSDESIEPGAATTASSAVAAGSATASAGASAAAALPVSPLAGSWRGAYEATKTDIQLDKHVHDKEWDNDKGAKLVGPGKVELTVDDSGVVEGQANGALGLLHISGQLDGNAIRATVKPDKPLLPEAMTGILVATHKEGTLTGYLRVADPRAELVRKADFQLKRAAEAQ